MKLKEIAFLKMGLVLNRKQANPTDSEKFKYKQLTLKSVTINEIVNQEDLEEFISKERLKEEYFTQKNDVIVRLSYPYTAIVIDEQTEGLLVPSHFIIIRCDLTKLLPEYLQWIFTSRKFRKEISISTGSSVLKFINPSFFSEMDVKILPLEKQKVFGEINDLYRREMILLEKLKIEKHRYFYLIREKIEEELERN